MFSERMAKNNRRKEYQSILTMVPSHNVSGDADPIIRYGEDERVTSRNKESTSRSGPIQTSGWAETTAITRINRADNRLTSTDAVIQDQ